MLSQTHAKLEEHFKSLSRERVSLGYPVYALEHNLNPDEINELRQALCGDLASTHRLSDSHWLLWTVVATEIGYAYDGEEYWHTFQSEIPPWLTSLPHRERVRGWFKDFKSRFNGFHPTGRWAEHFSIISWPITHSILPRYLQSLFARHLYELRHELAAHAHVEAAKVGRLLDERYYGHSSRFEGLLQQTALTAHLVLALRDEDVADRITPIYRPTLARIVQDLEQRSSSRGHLHDARRVLRDARMRVQQGLVAQPTSSSSPKPPAEAAFVTELKIMARRTQDDLWTIGLGLPDFDNLSRATGVEPGELGRNRLKFFDKPDQWMPGGALASYSGSCHWLSAMPAENTPVIEFRQPTDALKRFQTYLTLPTRPVRLLRVHGDGIARQILGNHVRTNEDYIVATAAPAASDLVRTLGLDQVRCRTNGVELYRMRSPRQASPAFLAGLKALGLGYALRARVKPFGLVPRWDEAHGTSVWLLNEEIVVNLSAEFPVSEFVIAINDGARTRVSAHAKHDLLVSLGALPIGRHVVDITATPPSTRHFTADIAPERILIEVRSPQPWRPDANTKSGLLVVLEPPNASLADIIEKRAAISVHGPSGRSATVFARLFDRSGHIERTEGLGQVTLPSQDKYIARAIEKLSKDPLSEELQSSPRIELAFMVDELGMASLSFPHPVAPFRWKFTRDSAPPQMRLIDESGAAANVSAMRYDIRIPDKRTPLATDECLKGIAVEAPGALFVARYDGKAYSALASVAPTGKITDFSALDLIIKLESPGEGPKNIMRLLAMLRTWRQGRPLGALATFRKRKILELFEFQIETLSCGTTWADKTQGYKKGRFRLEDLQREVGGSPGFASRMRTTKWNWYSDRHGAKAEFFRLSRTYGICQDKRICDLAMLLAFHPASIRLNDPKQGAADFVKLGSFQVLARGAHFAKLTSDIRFVDEATPSGGGA